MKESSQPQKLGAQLTGTDGHKGLYRVLPLPNREEIIWLDASGFELARSTTREDIAGISYRDDYELKVSRGMSYVRRVFRSS